MTDTEETSPSQESEKKPIDLSILDRRELEDLTKGLLVLHGFCPSCLCKKGKK